VGVVGPGHLERLAETHGVEDLAVADGFDNNIDLLTLPADRAVAGVQLGDRAR